MITMFMVTANVVGRYLFDRPFNGAFGYTESLLTVMIFFSLALTQHHRGHIKVVFLIQRMPAHLRRITQTLISTLSAIFFVLASYATFLFAYESYSIGEEVFDSVTYPIYPIKICVFIGLSLLSIQYILDALADAFGVEIDTKGTEE